MSVIPSSKKITTRAYRAQAIVEFALALPILLALLVGIFEVGRYLFIYSAVTNASRNAARYASAYGLNDSGNLKYRDCASIRTSAINSAFLVPASNLTITITYDHGPGLTPFHTCTGSVDTTFDLDSEDRVKVEVKTTYKPILKLVPIQPRLITSTTSRTILGIVELEP